MSVNDAFVMWMFDVDHITGNNHRKHTIVQGCMYYCSQVFSTDLHYYKGQWFFLNLSLWMVQCFYNVGVFYLNQFLWAVA